VDLHRNMFVLAQKVMLAKVINGDIHLLFYKEDPSRPEDGDYRFVLP